MNVHKLRNEIQDQVLFKKSICLCQHCKVFSNACAKVEKKSVLMTFRDRGNPRPHLTFSIKLNAKTNKSLFEKKIPISDRSAIQYWVPETTGFGIAIEK